MRYLILTLLEITMRNAFCMHHKHLIDSPRKTGLLDRSKRDPAGQRVQSTFSGRWAVHVAISATVKYNKMSLSTTTY